MKENEILYQHQILRTNTIMIQHKIALAHLLSLALSLSEHNNQKNFSLVFVSLENHIHTNKVNTIVVRFFFVRFSYEESSSEFQS